MRPKLNALELALMMLPIMTMISMMMMVVLVHQTMKRTRQPPVPQRQRPHRLRQPMPHPHQHQHHHQDHQELLIYEKPRRLHRSSHNSSRCSMAWIRTPRYIRSYRSSFSTRIRSACKSRSSNNNNNNKQPPPLAIIRVVREILAVMAIDELSRSIEREMISVAR